MEQKKWEFLLFHCLAAKSLVQNILMFCWFICCSWEVGRLLSWLCSNWITVNLNLLNLSFFSPSNGLEVEGNRVLFIRSFCFNRKQNVKKKKKKPTKAKPNSLKYSDTENGFKIWKILQDYMLCWVLDMLFVLRRLALSSLPANLHVAKKSILRVCSYPKDCYPKDC